MLLHCYNYNMIEFRVSYEKVILAAAHSILPRAVALPRIPKPIYLCRSDWMYGVISCYIIVPGDVGRFRVP